MHIKAIVSATAISLALGLSTFAYAQDAALPTSIAGQELSAEDAQRVKVACDDLQTEANQAVGAADATTTDTAAEPAIEGTSADTAAVGSVDLDAITVESCIEAGFLEAPAR